MLWGIHNLSKCNGTLENIESCRSRISSMIEFNGNSSANKIRQAVYDIYIGNTSTSSETTNLNINPEITIISWVYNNTYSFKTSHNTSHPKITIPLSFPNLILQYSRPSRHIFTQQYLSRMNAFLQTPLPRQTKLQNSLSETTNPQIINTSVSQTKLTQTYTLFLFPGRTVFQSINTSIPQPTLPQIYKIFFFRDERFLRV